MLVRIRTSRARRGFGRFDTWRSDRLAVGGDDRPAARLLLHSLSQTAGMNAAGWIAEGLNVRAGPLEQANGLPRSWVPRRDGCTDHARLSYKRSPMNG